MWLFIEINFTQKLHFLVSFNLVGTELYTSQQTGDINEVSLSELGKKNKSSCYRTRQLPTLFIIQ